MGKNKRAQLVHRYRPYQVTDGPACGKVYPVCWTRLRGLARTLDLKIEDLPTDPVNCMHCMETVLEGSCVLP